MTHADGVAPNNGYDQDGADRDWFTAVPGLEAPSQRGENALDDLGDNIAPCAAECPVDEQEHDELVRQLIREGEVLRTELGLPGFASADTLSSTSPTGAPEKPLAEHSDGAVHETDPAPAHNAGSHRARRRRVLRRFGTSRTPRTRAVLPHELAHLPIEHLISMDQMFDARYTASGRVRRMVMRHKADLVLWFCVLYGTIVLTGNVAFSVPVWLSTGSWVLLPAVVAWWRHLREDLHEPGIDQQPAPHDEDQRM
ncbi:hypothetical protein [Streptomyces sp. NPDC001381]|uniref:hypothetical protein n=1 Tax=Streptomyces sp. NPDC001381 TaxID=3364567 RepID=UPI0036CCCF58